MADIFISYSKQDLERVGRLVKRLEKERWSVFWDRKISVGQAWRKVLEAELKPAGCVLALWSSDSRDSAWVIEEAEVGRRRNVLLTALLDRVEPGAELRRAVASGEAQDHQAESLAAPPALQRRDLEQRLARRPVDQLVIA